MREAVLEQPPVFHPQTPMQHVKKAKRHADAQWLKAAIAAVKRLAKKRGSFTSADVLTELEKSEARTHDLRAIGPVMMEARDLGMIESAGLVRRNDKHTRAATTIWKSKLYPQGKQNEQETQPQSTDQAA